ncbi:MAG TPA: signal peptide peptidase SppA [Flavobacteriales bacterium]|nr:signal peptide peptidase SppA [Flavobacteriales bacterium]
MKGFLKSFFASFLGVFAALIFMGLFIMVIVSAIGSLSDDKPEIKENSILQIRLAKEIVDHAVDNPFENFDFQSFDMKSQIGLDDVLSSLDNASVDPKIKGIFLDISGLNAGMATIMEVRKAIDAFKESGKFIYAYSEGYSQFGYYLASAADEVHLYPEGEMDLKGLYMEMAMLKNMLNKVGVEAQVFRGPDNKYKSAAEALMYDKMSPENREQMQRLLDVVWEDWLTTVSNSRNISVDQLEAFADSILIREPQDAVKYGLVDKLSFRDEVMELLMAAVEVEKKDDLNMVSLAKYSKVPRVEVEGEEKPYKIKNKIGVIYASGNIVSGSGEQGQMGSASIVKAIEAAEKDTTVKAIVMRVNSGGGSALASDVMWRAAQKAKETKPFVVSMGDVAASGGYYISCGADMIFADENTITGSIGVIGIIPNMQELMTEKVGINFDVVRTNEQSDFLSVMRPARENESDIINESITRVYDTFISKVSEGRGIEAALVDSFARGRVWIGRDALERNLVDSLGGLDDAISAAAKLASLDNYKLRVFPKDKDPFQALMEGFNAQAHAYFGTKMFGDDFVYVEKIKSLREIQGIQMRLPYEMIIK